MMTTPLEPQPQYRLALRHECRWISCTDMDCPLCVQSSDRCFHNFSTSQIVRSVKRNDKISAGACVFKADCGAPISLTIIKIDGSQVEPLPRLKMQFTLVEYTEHLERHLNGMDFPAAQDVVGSILPMQLGLRQLLKAEGGQETYDNEDQLVLPFEHLDSPHPSQPHNQVFSKPVNVYVDTPLRNIVNCHSERVKRVGLLVRAVGHEDKILPALSTPFMLYTRRRDAKDTIPRPSDRVRDLSDMSDATCARLINLRQSAKDQGNVGVPLEQLPDEPISTAGQMYDFLEGKSEDFLAVVSMKVLKRPKDCLLNLRKELDSKMIKMENDTRPRVWRDDKDPDGTCLLYAASKGICNLIFTATNPKVYDSDWKLVSTTDTDWERRQNHDLAVAAWHQPGHPDWGFDPRHSPPRKVGSAAAAAAPPASTWSKALQPQAASTGQAQQPQVGSSPLALLGGLPGGFSYPEGGWPRSLSQATGLQDQASMSEALATAVSSQSHLRQMMQNPYSQGGSGRPPGLQSQPGSGAATSAPSSGQSLVPPYLQGISFTRLSAHSPSRQIGNRFVEAPEPLPDYLEESSVAAPQSAAASPIPTSVLEPNACMGPPLTPWSNGDHAIYRPGPAAQQKATRAPHAMQLPSTAGNATWPGFSNGSGAAGQGYLRAQNQPRLPPPETSDGVSQNPKFPPQQAAPPLSWQEPLTGPQPMQLSPQETIAREAGLGPEASQAPLTLPGRPLGTGRTTAASLQPPAPLQVPSALGESMLHLCDPATAAYGEAAGSVKAMLEDIAKLPSNLLVGGSRPNSAILTPFLARLERQLTSDLAAPVAELLKTLERLASAPEYRCVFVGLAESGKSTVLDAIKDLSLASTSQNGASSTPVENLAERVHEHEAMVAGVTLGLVDTPGHLGGPSSDTRQELGDQLRRADAVFLVLDYNSLDASLEWAQERLAWLKLGDRLHVVVNKVEDASLIHNCENEQEAAKRIRQFLFSRDLAVPNNQVWLLSASEARLCMSIRLRQAGLLRREGNVQDKLFRLMVWGRQAPAAISDAEFTREVEAAFAKSGLGRLGRESVAMLHKRVGSRRLMDAVQSAEALLARARNSCLVFDAALERNSMIAAQVHQQVDEGQAAGSQQQQPCFLPQLVRRSLSAITAWISSPVPMGMELPVVKLQPLIYFMQELASSPALKELVEAAKEIAEVDGSREPQLHQQGILNFFKRKVATLGVELQNYDPASMWAKSDSKQRALHCQQWVRGQLRVGALAGAGTGSDVQSQDQSGLIRTAAEAMVGEGLLGGLVQQQPGWQDVLEEARRDLQESLLRLLTRQPEGMQEFVSELADLCRSLPASDWGAWLGVESLEELEERLSAVREAMTWFQAFPLPELGSFAQRCHTWQQQVGADANPRVKRQRTKAFLSLFSGAAKDPEKACVECGTKTTHEWCSGPAGPATLCQSCGKSYRRGKDSHKKEQLKDAKTSSRIQEKEGGSASRASLRQSSEQNPPRKSTARQSKMELNKAKAGEKRKPSESDAAAALMGLRAGDSQASGPSHAAEDPDVVFYGRKKRSRAPAAAIRLDIRDQHSESDSLVSFDSADDSGSEEEACGNAMQEGSEAPSPKWCTECETTATPVWRSGPQGRKTLCNPCGVKYKASIRKEMDTSR